MTSRCPLENEGQEHFAHQFSGSDGSFSRVEDLTDSKLQHANHEMI